MNLSNGLDVLGKGASIFGYVSVANAAYQRQISPFRASVDASVVTVGWRGGLPGASFAFG